VAISLNVLGLPVPDVPALVAWCVVARPPYALVMDNLEIAGRIRMASPDTQIICRKYRPDDHKLHETTSPAEFLDSVADVPAAFICQCLNEPGGDQAQLANWCAALIRLADVRGRRLALPNWSVGNPDTEAVAGGLYDALWHAMAASGKHVLGLHEYALNSPLHEPFHIGRYRAILQRFDALKLARPVVVMTEHGRDLAGGRDGWRTVFNEQEYAKFLDDAQTVYAPDNVTACVFAWGKGFDDRWATYDVEGAPDLLRAMEAMNVGREDDDVAGPPGWKTAVVGPKGVNLRPGPGIKYAPVAVVMNGDWVRRLPGSEIKADGWTWIPVALEKNEIAHTHGWVASEVLKV
jgi:hypothetical protein